MSGLHFQVIATFRWRLVSNRFERFTSFQASGFAGGHDWFRDPQFVALHKGQQKNWERRISHITLTYGRARLEKLDAMAPRPEGVQFDSSPGPEGG